MKKMLIFLVVFYTATHVSAQTLDTLISLNEATVGPFCPKALIKGDRDFAGRGPEIWASVQVTFTRIAVVATLKFRAKELPGGDNSETSNATLKILYSAPRDYYITDVQGGKYAEVHFVSKSPSTVFSAGGLAKALNLNSSSAGLVDKSDGLVKRWEIYGDTNGPDISDDDNCDDDTRIKIVLNGLKIKMAKTPAAQGLSTIRLEDINEWLCPSKLVRGDREFDGHGPKVKSEVKLRIADNGTKLFADITFNAKETQQDWSEAEGSWSKLVYEAPYGKRITEILSDKASRTQFISPAAGFQALVPGQDLAKALNTFLDATDIQAGVLQAFGVKPENKGVLQGLIKGTLENGNTVVQVPPVEGALVKFFHIVGDTGGPDISTDNNCNDDTRIVKIEFFPVRIKMVDAK
ncbi:MAG: hypothetical protein ABI675_24435 [Chitinophagaceae bacterium]